MHCQFLNKGRGGGSEKPPEDADSASPSPDRPSRGQAAPGDVLELPGVSGCGLLTLSGPSPWMQDLTPSKGPLPGRLPPPGPGLLPIKEMVSEVSQPAFPPVSYSACLSPPTGPGWPGAGGLSAGPGSVERAVLLLSAVLLGQLTVTTVSAALSQLQTLSPLGTPEPAPLPT